MHEILTDQDPADGPATFAMDVVRVWAELNDRDRRMSWTAWRLSALQRRGTYPRHQTGTPDMQDLRRRPVMAITHDIMVTSI